MAHLPVMAEDEKYVEMMAHSPGSLEFGELSAAPASGNRPQRGHSALDYPAFLEQNPSFLSQPQHQEFAPDFHTQAFLFDPVMFANPNQNVKLESPDLLSPASIGPAYGHAHNSEYLSSQSPYSDAASHFSGAADPPTAYFERPLQHTDTFSQEISLGGSISSTNLAEMNLAGHAMYSDNVYARGAYSSSEKFYTSEFQNNHPGVQLDSETVLQQQQQQQQQENWRYGYSQLARGDTFLLFQNMQSLYDSSNNKLTENNLLNYNGKVDAGDAKVTISIHQAPELAAARTPSLFSNSSHNSLHGKQPDYSGNQLQRPGHSQWLQSPSLSPSPAHSWQRSPSPSLSANPPSPGGSVYSDVGPDAYLRPEDYQNMRRGRQAAHQHKVRSQLRSRSRSRSGPMLVLSGTDYDSESERGEVGEGDLQEQMDEAAKSTREKMLELASSVTVSKRTQIHPSSYACYLCEKKFTRPYNLKSHLRTHTDERPFICSICGKAFARQHDRKRHEDLHSGEKKYQCRGILKDGTPFGCGRKFARADALRRHFQTESGRECIKLLVEEDAREQNDTGTLSSGIQLPDGEFMNPNAPEIPLVSVLPPQQQREQRGT